MNKEQFWAKKDVDPKKDDALQVPEGPPGRILDRSERWRIQRPRKFKSPEEFLERAQEYITSCLDTKGELIQPLTITGMCNFLGTTRERLLGYEMGSLESIKAVEGDDEKWRDAVKRVKHICEHYAEIHGFEARNPAFAIFALKNYGWKDIQTIESTTTEIHTISPDVRQLIGDYHRLLIDRQKLEVIDVTPQAGTVPITVDNKVVNLSDSVDNSPHQLNQEDA